MTPDELRQRAGASLPKAALLVALGGGADSAVAAWVCATTSAVRCIFVDHGLEGSPGLRAAAGKLSAELGLDLVLVEAHVGDGPNLEGRARDARWNAISAATAPGEIVVTGHTRDDLAETVLMNLLRGAGARGLAAMAAPRRGIMRPLLEFDRRQVRSVAEQLPLPFVDDPANARMDLLRNRVRTDLVPLLDRDYQPGVRANLGAAASLLASDDAALEVRSAAVPIREDGEAVLLPVAVLTTVPRPVAARAVRAVLRRLNPPYAGRQDDIHAVLRTASSDGPTTTLGGGLTAAREGPYVAIWGKAPSIPEPASITVPSTVAFGDHVLSVRFSEAGPTPRSTVAIEPTLIEAGVELRAAGEGTRIDLDQGTKLVRDALSEMGIPVRRRPAWPVVADGARIVGIVAGRVAPWARPAGGRTVEITLESK